MNKLIIIGNGFDLAHGLPTSYKHFMDDFWSSFKNNFSESNISELVFFNANYLRILEYGKINNLKDFLKNIKSYSNDYADIRFNEENLICQAFSQDIRFKNVLVDVFQFKNDFFKHINQKQSIQNWVDIENEYYLKLKTIINLNSLNSIQKKNHLIQLNEDFEKIRQLFEEYLINKVDRKFDFKKAAPKNIESLLNYFKEWPKRYLETNSYNDKLLEFPKEDQEILIDFDNELYEYYKNKNIDDFLKNSKYSNVFLNFNYTASLEKYCSLMNDKSFDHSEGYFKTNIISIHGSLNDVKNLMNFGFGDEMDEDYKNIENLNDNEYLKNIKSFKYSQNSNYKKLIDFIDSEKFQIYILGHSCGLSDRTLLNTIFEHENCRSIKVFYHQWKDDLGTKFDNYTEIIQNISRHFKDKKTMRSKIVNKSLCDFLPQEIRFSISTTHE